MKREALSSFAVGLIFAIGLGLSGMTQPQKVIGFLDIFGAWDPSLMFVMIGAIAVHCVTYRLIRKRKSPVFSNQWHVPTDKALTPTLIGGAFLFGIGWGLGGFCPGPAVVSLASLQSRPAIFVASLLIGMLIFRQFDKKFRSKSRS